MTNQNTGGVSPRSLILLGAFAALALNRDLRRGLVSGTRDVARSAQETYQGTLETLREDGPQWLEEAQSRAEQLAHIAALRAAGLREEAEDAVQQLQKDYRREYAPKLRGLVGDLGDTADERRQQAEKALGQVRKRGLSLLGDVQDRAEDLRGQAEDTRRDARRSLLQAGKQGAKLVSEVQDRASEWIAHAEDALDEGRRDAERRLNRARRDAQKELRRANRDWDADKLERAVSKKVAPLQKQLGRELARLEKDAAKRRGALSDDSGSAGVGTGAALALALGAGVVVLARMPQARRALLDAVESVNPDAAKSLHSASRKARDLVGSMWLESMDESKPAAAPAPASTTAPAPGKGTQAGTTGATWGGATESGSAANKGMSSTSPAPKPGDAPKASAPEVKGDRTDKADEKPQTSAVTDSFLKDDKKTN